MIPSGILPNWQQKQLQPKLESCTTPRESFALGGLDDGDAYAPAPVLQSSSHTSVIQNRTNSVQSVSFATEASANS